MPHKIEFEADFLPGVVSPSLFRLVIFFFLAAATDQADQRWGLISVVRSERVIRPKNKAETNTKERRKCNRIGNLQGNEENLCISGCFYCLPLSLATKLNVMLGICEGKGGDETDELNDDDGMVCYYYPPKSDMVETGRGALLCNARTCPYNSDTEV